MSNETSDAPESSDIHQLDEDTVARIAAGEVVERPASAVKELVENSLDAGAETVDVTIEAGGTELIRVADDGDGMTEADVRTAIRQHTTSKIQGLEDLESGVATLGFRGEALHTIGSVSRLTIRSRPREAEGAGTELRYEGGDVVSVEPTGCPAGTIVEVADLFYNTPARQKFLKTTATEFAHVNRVVTRYALANPDVAVSLTHDDREVFATTGQGDLQAAVLSVYGREVASSMIAVDAGGDELPPGPLDAVTGLVSHPETNRSSREYLATYVNGRAVSADAIREGIMGAYGTQLGSDRYPFVVLFLDVPGDAVDVNVHPRKREVRFDDGDAVRRQVDSAVESALLDNGLLRSGAPRGRSAPDEARLEPTLDGSAEQADTAGETAPTKDRSDAAGTSGESVAESRSIDDTASDSVPDDRSPESDSDVDAGADADSRPSTDTSSTETVAESATESGTDREREFDRRNDAGGTADTAPSRDSGGAGGPPDRKRTGDGEDANRTQTTDKEGADRTPDRPDRRFDGPAEQRTLAGEAATGEKSAFDTLPSMRVLGQIHDTYLVCELPDGLALIDQHAADERVNYERLRDAFQADPATQALASPVELELTAIEAEAFESYKAALERLGFYADRIDDRTVAVTTVPAVFEETLNPVQFRDVLASFVEGDRDAGAETVDALADEFLGDLACYPSLTGNTSLTEGSVIDLLEALDGCENPYACPHGRPVIVEIDESEIQDRFERDYPGHGG